MRLPGTCSRYSKKAIPQLSSAARYQGRSARLRRCAYQAKVMKTLEAMSSRVADSTGFIGQLSSAGDAQAAQVRQRRRVVAVHDAGPAARAGRRHVVGTVVDEHRGGRLEREAPLGLAIDAGVGLHDPGEIGRQRAVAD